VWIDSSAAEGAKVVKVKFASDAYFELASSAPALREALALGENLTVRVGPYCLVIGDGGKEAADDADVKAVIKELSK
jgi:hypothetical protein